MVIGLLKKFFKKNPEEIHLSPEDVPGFIYEKSLEAETEMQSILDSSKDEFKQIVGDSREKMKELRDAKLRNPNIPKREIDFMNGNRFAYMKKLVLFIKSISFPVSLIDIPLFHDELQTKFDEFTKQSYRAYQIVGEFFGDEVQRLNSTLSRFSKLDKRLMDKYAELRIEEIGNIIDEINKSHSAIKAAKSFNDRIDMLKNEASKIDEDSSGCSGIISKFESSKENKNYKKMIKDTDILDDRIKKSMHTFLTPFSSIQHSMRKYSKIAIKHTEWIDAYLEDPIMTLLSDENLVILDILASLKKNISSLSLNEKKEARLKKNIAKIDNEFISSFRTKMGEKKKKKDDMSSKIRGSDITARIKEKQEELDALNDRKNIISRQIDEINAKLAKIETDPINDKLIERINNALNLVLVLDK